MTSDRKYDSECDNIYNAFEYSDFIVVNGAPSVGKTALVKYLLIDHDEQANYYHSYTFCDGAISNSGEFYTQIVNDLSAQMKFRPLRHRQIRGHQDFVTCFEQLIEVAKSKFKKIIVVLDRPERLKRTNMLDNLTVLATTVNLKLLVITTNSAEAIIRKCFKLSVRASLQSRCVQFTLPVWSLHDITEQICKFEPTKDVDLYKKFVNNVVQVYYHTRTKNYIELRSICQDHFGKFLDYYKNEIRKSVSSMIPEARDLTPEELDKYIEEENISLTKTQETNLLTTFLCPHRMKYENYSEVINKKCSFKMASLIVAAYIAAHTRTMHDKRNFVKLQKRKGRMQNVDFTKPDPKPFTMERLLHIQKALEGPEDPSEISSDDIFRVALLEREKIIQVVGSDTQQTSTLYKLSKNVPEHYIKRMSKVINIDELSMFHGIDPKIDNIKV